MYNLLKDIDTYKFTHDRQYEARELDFITIDKWSTIEQNHKEPSKLLKILLQRIDNGAKNK